MTPTPTDSVAHTRTGSPPSVTLIVGGTDTDTSTWWEVKGEQVSLVILGCYIYKPVMVTVVTAFVNVTPAGFPVSVTVKVSSPSSISSSVIVMSIHCILDPAGNVRVVVTNV